MIKQTIASVGKKVENLEPSYIATGDAIWQSHLEKHFHSFWTVKFKITK